MSSGMAVASSRVHYNISDHQQQSQRKRPNPTASTAIKMQYVNVSNTSNGGSAGVFGGASELSVAAAARPATSCLPPPPPLQSSSSAVHYPTYQNIVANSAAFMRASFCNFTPRPLATPSTNTTATASLGDSDSDSSNCSGGVEEVDRQNSPVAIAMLGTPAPAYANVPPSPAAGSVNVAYLRSAYSRLRQSGWYYEKCDAGVATELLGRTEPGTFLVRDSAHAHFLFSISMQTQRGPTSLRVAWHDDSASFYVDVDQLQTPLLPRFNCVIRLVSWLVAMSQSGSGSTLTSSSWAAQETSFSGGGTGAGSIKAPVAILEIADDKNAIPVLLRRPLLHTVLPLASLCRKAVHACRLRDRVHDKQLSRFLDQYPYSL